MRYKAVLNLLNFNHWSLEINSSVIKTCVLIIPYYKTSAFYYTAYHTIPCCTVLCCSVLYELPNCFMKTVLNCEVHCILPCFIKVLHIVTATSYGHCYWAIATHRYCHYCYCTARIRAPVKQPWENCDRTYLRGSLKGVFVTTNFSLGLGWKDVAFASPTDCPAGIKTIKLQGVRKQSVCFLCNSK